MSSSSEARSVGWKEGEGGREGERRGERNRQRVGDRGEGKERGEGSRERGKEVKWEELHVYTQWAGGGCYGDTIGMRNVESERGEGERKLDKLNFENDNTITGLSHTLP